MKFNLKSMKSTSLGIILIVLMTLFITGCKKSNVISGKQSILFQMEYVNYAWGFQHSGLIIDSEGNVLTYNNPELWNSPDNDLILNEKEVAENIGSCTISDKKIPEEELRKYSGYIKNIASSKVSALKNVAADAGSTQFICYQYSESTGMYKGYIIKMEGDFTCENLNFYSKKTSAWMRDIYTNLYKK
jgi:hypothetical protein